MKHKCLSNAVCQQPTHFPHSFRMPFWFFLCSGETGDCWPDSTPDDIGERSDKVESFVFSVFPVNRKQSTCSDRFMGFYVFIGSLLDWIHILSVPTNHKLIMLSSRPCAKY